METPGARAQLQRLKDALDGAGVQGVSWEDLPLADGDRVPAVAARLSAAIALDALERARALVAAVLEAAPWCSVPCLRVHPDSARGRIVLRVDVVSFDPEGVFHSAEARRAARRPDASPAVSETAVVEGLRALFEARGLDETERMQRVVYALEAASVAVGADRAGTFAHAVEGLGEGGEALVRDVLLLARRGNDHHRTLVDLEGFLEKELRQGDGTLQGRALSHGTWTPPPKPRQGWWGDDPQYGGGDALEDLAPPAPRDLAADVERLGSVVEDDALEEGVRLDALRKLQGIDLPESRRWRLRALGWSKIFLNAVHHAPLADAAPLIREIVLSRDHRRIAAALMRLRGFGRDGLDAAAIWAEASRRDAPDEEVRLAPLFREALLEAYAATADASVVPAIAEELASHADEPGWVRVACALFEKTGQQAAAADAVAALLRPESPEMVRAAAASFFAGVSRSGIVPRLRRALAGSGWERRGALRGLAGQGEAGRREILAWLEKRLAGPDDEDRDADVSAALDALRGATLDPGLLERAASAGRSSAAAARSFVTPGALAAGAGDDLQIAGATPEETFDGRIRLWLSDGHALRRYRASGHRDPAWDADVESAHQRYWSAEPHPGAHPGIGEAYERAIARGCRDGIVLYRAGSCAAFRGETALAAVRIREALEWIPRQYPHSVYLAAGECALARIAKKEGRIAEALAWAKRAVAHDDVRERGSTELLESLEHHVAALALAERLPDLSIGSLRLAPGLRHAHPATSLSVNGMREALVVSADAGGFVQITQLEAMARGHRLVPLHRERRHRPGRTAACWVTETHFVSAGSGGAHLVDATDPRRPEVVRTLALEDPPTAIACTAALTVALGDAAGRVSEWHTSDDRATPRGRLRFGEIRRLLPIGRDRLAAVDAEGRLGLLDDAGARVVDLSFPVEIEAVLLDRNGRLLCFGGGAGAIVDPRTGALLGELPTSEQDPLALRQSPDGREMVAMSGGGVRVHPRPGVWYGGSEPLLFVEPGWNAGAIVMITRTGWLRVVDLS